MSSPVIQLTQADVAQHLGVSRTSHYYQRKLPAKDAALKAQIEAVWAASASQASYGHRRLAMDLKVNKKRIRRVMKIFGLKPPRRRIAQPVKLDDQGKPPTHYQNLVNYLCPLRPNVVWAVDFTYFWFQGRWFYLATVLDVFTREIIGWAVSANHDTALVLAALRMAHTVQGRWPIYHHSDQGSEYDSVAYVTELTANQVQISMSRKASPWENGYQESFYNQFKVDLGQLDQFDSVGELVAAIATAIHDYNTNRIHTSLKTTPATFRAKYDEMLFASTIPFGDKLPTLSRQLV